MQQTHLPALSHIQMVDKFNTWIFWKLEILLPYNLLIISSSSMSVTILDKAGAHALEEFEVLGLTDKRLSNLEQPRLTERKN